MMNSIEAMKQALQALETKGEHHPRVYEAITALRQAIAEAEKQEPVAWMTHTNAMMPLFHMTRKSALNWETQPTPLYKSPVHVIDMTKERVDEKEKCKHEWVGLTDEEIYDYANKFLYQHGSNYGIKSFGKAIEAKLKEKNT